MIVLVDNDNNDVLHKAIRTYGCCAQQDIAIEEMSELTKAILKFRRAGIEVDPMTKEKLRANVAEELADVLICAEQLKIMYDITDDVEAWEKKKLQRLKERLELETAHNS